MCLDRIELGGVEKPPMKDYATAIVKEGHGNTIDFRQSTDNQRAAQESS